MPILGICYGAQLLAQKFGGNVEPSATREYGRANLTEFDAENPLFHHISPHSQVWMSHGDTITQIPTDFTTIARTESIPVAAFQVQNEATFGLQFHPEVTHSLEGKQILLCFRNLWLSAYLDTYVFHSEQCGGSKTGIRK